MLTFNFQVSLPLQDSVWYATFFHNFHLEKAKDLIIRSLTPLISSDVTFQMPFTGSGDILSVI